MRKNPITIVLVGLLFVPQVVSADESSFSDRTPITADYIDAATNLVYHYDARLGVLTPTGGSSIPSAGYVVADAAFEGDIFDPLLLDPGTCLNTICFRAQVLITGSHEIRLSYYYWYLTGNACINFSGGFSDLFPAQPGLVTRLSAGHDFNDSAVSPCLAVLDIYIDGNWAAQGCRSSGSQCG